MTDALRAARERLKQYVIMGAHYWLPEGCSVGVETNAPRKRLDEIAFNRMLDDVIHATRCEPPESRPF